MLVQFTVENFMSFEKETTFSMAATPSDETHPDHVCQPENNEKGGPLLRAAALYGANASGKSNLIKAIAFARNLIVEGTRFGERLYPQPFRLSDAREKPSRFQFIFRTGGVLYEYGFVLDNDRIHEEWLFGTENTLRAKEKKYFERTTDVDGKTKVEIGANLKALADGESQRLQFVAEGTRPNQLYLRELFEKNFEHLLGIMQWFYTLNVLAPDALYYANRNFLIHQTETNKRAFLSLLQAAGTNITAIISHLVAIDLDSEFPTLSESIRRGIQTSLEQSWRERKDDQPIVHYADTPEKRLMPLSIDQHGRVCRVELKFQRKGKNGDVVLFSPDEESDGTQRLLYLLPHIENLRQDREAVYFVDELDRRLHTLISRTFLQVALSGTNRNSQLIFTTHDTNLLDLDLLRRDEIWFVEKDNGGASHLYSLAEFKIRPDLKVEKGYLNGRFGAIPYIGDVSKLGFTDNAAPIDAAASEE